MSKDTVEIEWVRKEVHDKRAVNLSIKRKETLSGSYPSIFVATIMFTQGYLNTSPAYQHEIYAGSEPATTYQQNHMASVVEPPPNMTHYSGLNSAIQSMQQFCYPVMPTRVQQLRGLQKIPLVAPHRRTQVPHRRILLRSRFKFQCRFHKADNLFSLCKVQCSLTNMSTFLKCKRNSHKR